MAAVNKNKLLDNATKYIQKGQIDRAIKELQKVIDADPADVRTRLKLGDLFAKKNQNAEAAEQYTLVAESYSKDGFYLKAVAVYKQILKLDSSLIDVHLKLGDLYHQLGLLSDAMGQYQIVVQHYDQKGMATESLAVLRKMVELDPENVQSRKKLAEIIAREGNTADAIAEFQKIAEELKAKGRLDDLAGVLERIVHLDQGNLDVVRELAALYLDRGDPKRALAKLQICFRANPQDLATLEMLSKAFVALGQPEKAKSVLREISKIHHSAGNNAAMMVANRGILQIDPGDAEARAAVEGRAFTAEAEPSMAPSPFVPPSASQPAPVMARSPDVAPSRAAAAPAAAAAPIGSVAPDDPQTIQKLLTEADVYLKYGLLEKALDHLRGIVRRNPKNVDAHLKLKDVYLQHKDPDSAANEIVAVIDLCNAQGDTQRAAEALQEGLSFAPGNAALEIKQAEMGGSSATGDAASWDGGGDDDAVEISIDAESDNFQADIGIDEPGTAQIEASLDAGGLDDEGSVEIQVDGSDGEGTEAEMGGASIIDESVDVSVIDDVAMADADVVIDPGPALEDVEIEDEPAMAQVVSLDSRRDPSGAAIRMPEPSAISPDQLLSELATAFEPTEGPLDADEPSISLDDAAGALDDVKMGDDVEISVDDEEIEIDAEPEFIEPVPVARSTARAPEVKAPIAPPPVMRAEAPKVAPVVEPPKKSRVDRFLDEPVVEAKPEMMIEEPLDLPTDDDIAVEDDAPIVMTRPAPIVDVKTPPPVAAKVVAPPVVAKAVSAPAPATASVATNDDPIPADILEDVDEADFFVKQEIYDEAIAVYKRLLKKFPGNGGLTARLAKAEAYLRGEKPVADVKAKPAPVRAAPEAVVNEPVIGKPAPAPAPVAAKAPEPAPVKAPEVPAVAAKANGAHPPEPPKAPVMAPVIVEETGGFDLAAELGDIFEDIEEDDDAAPAFDENEQVSVGDVLREFRKGVEKQIGSEDKESRYNLGIAFREMGLLDEAIGEFEIAGGAPERKADCLSMVGICQRDKGDNAAAIQSFSAAIKTPGTNDKQKASFFYELAATLEITGEMAKAQKMLQQVQALDPSFRDVADKLGKSKSSASAAPASGSDAVPNKKISFI